MKDIIKFFKHTKTVRKLVIVVLFLSVRYAWFIKNRPFKEIAHMLGQKDKEDLLFVENDLDLIRDIRIAINMVCNHTLWESKCLVQAFVAKHLLDKRGIPATVYLGIRKDENGDLKAHAWTKCGQYFVTGKKGSRQYTVTSCFS